MMLIFVTHATSYDNENGLASGHNDVALSSLGVEQARELGLRYQETPLSAIYCSDLQRSYKTAEIAFAGRNIPVIRDPRLRECDYGEMTQADAGEIKKIRLQHVFSAFPGGESYEQACGRMKEFLNDVIRQREDDEVFMVIGHRATQYGLEHNLKGVPISEAVGAPWTWQPGWQYEIKGMTA